MADVFLSYSHRDRQRAETVVRRLEEAGFSVWWDPEIRKGRFEELIEKERRKARCALVLWSPSSVESDWVRAEADRSRIDDKLVQFRIDDRTRLPLPFEWLHLLELTDWDPEPTESGFSELLQAVKDETQRSPVLRKAKRQARQLWRPTRASRLRPWELLTAGVLGLGLVGILLAWGIGFFNAGEAGLWSAAVLVGWVSWLLVRPHLERRLEVHPWGLKRLCRTGVIAAALAAAWAGGFHLVYAVPSFAEGVSGFYVARLVGDRWDRQQRELVDLLEQQIREQVLDIQLRVARLPRRVASDEEARALLRRGNAALLIRGETTGGEDHALRTARFKLELRRAPGIVSGGSVVGRGREAAVGAATERDRIQELARALGLFFAGYTLYHDGHCDLAVARLEPAAEVFRALAGHELLLTGGTVGVQESLLGTALLFLGNCRALLGDAKAAIADYEEAVEATRPLSGPQFVEALVNQGVILIEEGAITEAMEPLERGEKACRARVRLPVPGRSSNDWTELVGCSYLQHNLGVAEVLLDDPAGGRERFESALEVTEAAIELAPADQGEELLALQAFNHQKLAWAAAKEHQWRQTAGDEARAGDELLAAAAESLKTAVTLWREHQDAPLPEGFGITEARLDVARTRWPEARQKLEQLVAKGAGNGDPEVFLLLAITQACSGDPMGSLQTFGSYVNSYVNLAEDFTVGREHYRYWRNRCKNNE